MEEIFKDSNTLITPELNDFYSNSFLVKGNPANDDILPAPKIDEGVGDENEIRALINQHNNRAAIASNNISNLQSNYTDPLADAKIFAFNPTYKGLNWDRYKSSSEFDKLGFDPFRDNEKFYNDNTSIWSDVTRGAKGFLQIAGGAFVTTASDLPKMLTGDFSPNMEAARETERIMAETMSTRGTLGSSIINFGINAGFTVGILAELATEEAILALGGIGGALETGGTSLGAAGYLAAVRAGMAGSKIMGLGKTTGALLKSIRHLDNAADAKKYFTQFGRGAAEFLNPLQSTAGLVKNWNSLNGLGQVARASKSFGAFFKDIRDINRSLSEAKLEGGFVQNTMFEKLLGEAYADGKTPTVEQINDIKEKSLHAGYVNEMINFPVIQYTNNIVFGNITKPINKLLGSTQDTFKLLGKTISGDISRKEVFKVLGDGWKESAKRSLNPRLMTQNTLNYFSANLAEGLQESFQEASSLAVEDYYTKQFHNEHNIVKNHYELSMLDSYGKGLGAQFSGQGAETFLSGFLMGGLMSGGSRAIKKVSSGINESSNKIKDFFYSKTDPEAFTEIKEKRENVKAQREAKAAEYDQLRNTIVKNLNEFYADAGNMFTPDLANMSAQEILAAKSKQAAENGDNKFLIDFTDEALFKNVSAALYTGKFDLFLEHLDKINSMDDQGIMDALGTNDAQAGRQRLEVSIERAKNIKQRSEKFAENPFKFNDYEKGTEEHTQMVLMHNAYEDAKNSAIFAPYQFDRVLSRMSSITDAFTSIDLVANGNAIEFLHLFGLESMINEKSILSTEVESLKDGTPENEKLAKVKEQQIKDLDDLQKTIIEHKQYYIKLKADETVNPKYDNDLKEAFVNYLSNYANIKNDVLKSDKLEEAFDLFRDYYRLNIDSEFLSRSVAVIADPNFLRNESLRRYNALKKVHTNRKDLIKKSIDDYLKKIGLNGVFQKLYDEGFVGDPKQMVAYNLSGGKKRVTTFYRVSDFSRVTAADTEDIAKINEIFNEYEDITGITKDREEAAKKAELAAAKKVEEEVAAAKLAEKEKALDIYTPETKAKLVADYENYELKDQESFEEYLSSPRAARIIAAEKQPAPVPAPIITPAPEVIIPENLEDTPGYAEAMGIQPIEIQPIETKPVQEAEVIGEEEEPTKKELSDFQKESNNFTLEFNVSKSIKAYLDKRDNKWRFFNKKGKEVKSLNQILKYGKELIKKPNLLKLWYTEIISDNSREAIKEYITDLYQYYQEGMENSNTTYVDLDTLLISKLVNRKFRDTNELSGNLTDVNLKKWINNDLGSVDTLDIFASLIQQEVAENGFPNYDSQDIMYLIVDIIQRYPNGISEKTYKQVAEDNAYNKKLLNLIDDFALQFGLDLESVTEELNNVINSFEEYEEDPFKFQGEPESYEDFSGYEEFVNEKERQEVKENFPLSSQFEGKIIYFSPGLGKSTLVKQYPDQFIDMDILLYEEFKDEPGFENATPETIGDVVFDMYDKLGFDNFNPIKEKYYNAAFEKARELNKQGKTVLTGSGAFISKADFSVKANNEDISKEGLKNKNPNITDERLAKSLKSITKRENQNNILLSVDKDSFVQFLMGNYDILQYINNDITLKQLEELGKFMTSKSSQEVIEAYSKKMEYLQARELLFSSLQPGDTVIVLNEKTGESIKTTIMKKRDAETYDLDFVSGLETSYLKRNRINTLLNVIPAKGASEGIKVDDIDNTDAENNKTKVNDIATETERLKALLNESFNDDDLFEDAEDPNNCKTK